MTPKRQKVQNYILSAYKKLDPSNKNYDYMKSTFDAMTDKQFDEFMTRLKNKEETLSIYSANMTDKLSIDDLKDTAVEFGVKLFERIRMWDEPTQRFYLTPKEYCVLQLPARRMSQFIDHKMSVAEGDSRIDMLSGQVVKPDKAAAISQVEIQTMYAKNLDAPILELLKYRGGDTIAYAEYRRELEEQGRTSVSRDTGSVARSAVVFDMYLSGLHIESNASGV